jgi:hypothetical protein
MPMDKSRYPDDWDAIALAKKEKADWTCEQCDKPCQRPGESIFDLVHRLSDHWVEELSGENRHGEPVFKKQRFCLTVAHMDQNPANNADENLRALCCPCHLKYDHQYLSANRSAKLERQGQTSLLNPLPIRPEKAGHGRSAQHVQSGLW